MVSLPPSPRHPKPPYPPVQGVEVVRRMLASYDSAEFIPYIGVKTKEWSQYLQRLKFREWLVQQVLLYAGERIGMYMCNTHVSNRWHPREIDSERLLTSILDADWSEFAAKEGPPIKKLEQGIFDLDSTGYPFRAHAHFNHDIQGKKQLSLFGAPELYPLRNEGSTFASEELRKL